MKRTSIIVAVLLIVGLLLYFGFQYFSGNLIGGGGSQQYAPDTVQAGEPAEVTLIVTATGGGGNIQGRFTDVSLHYRLVGETEYGVVQPQSIPLPDNFKTVQSKTFQSEAYTFTIPPYPQSITGEIEYYTELTFDGYQSRQEGVKKIKVVNTVPRPEVNQNSQVELQPTTGLETNEYVAGQYLDFVGKVAEYGQDCGGGEYCLSELRIFLPENMTTNDIFNARISIENCVDKTLRTGDIVYVKGRIQNVVPNIGLILSCADTKTSVTRKEESVAKELDVTSQPAYLVGMYMSERKYYAELDYVEWLHSEEQLQAMIEDGQCPSSGADCYVYPNGYKRNKNPLIHSVPLASDVAIELSGTISILSGGYGMNGITIMTLAEFAQVIQSEISTANKQTNEFRDPITFVKVDIKGGSITRIVEPYQE